MELKFIEIQNLKNIKKKWIEKETKLLTTPIHNFRGCASVDNLSFI